MASSKSRGRRINGKGTFIYRDFQDNHVIWPGRERDLDQFLGQSFKGISHKRKNARSSNSEDALTWSCFDTLANVSQSRRALALEELWELAYGDMPAPDGLEASTIHIGKSYGVGKKITEVDLSFEGDGFLVLVEAKLYSHEPSRFRQRQASQSDCTQADNRLTGGAGDGQGFLLHPARHCPC